MANDGTITYAYTPIHDGVEAMRDCAKGIEQDADDLVSKTKALMAGHWGGDTANKYKEKSDTIKGKLEGIRTHLENLSGSVEEGAHQMQLADKRGAS